jgi:hypothetical protein
MSKKMSKRLSKRLSKRNRRNKHTRRNKSMKGGTGFRAPEYVNFVPYSESTFSNSEPLVRALGAASR